MKGWISNNIFEHLVTSSNIFLAISPGNSCSFVALNRNREFYLDEGTEVISSFQAVITHLIALLHPATAPWRASDHLGLDRQGGEQQDEIIYFVC